ncbi:MAG: hypothetical protein OXC99_07865 [Chloroflexi bacterium]|nr:hypothetical protein [Chloroflexota bacterium]
MTSQDPESTVPISERVKFWEEQDKINKELIPRVIRQHELLTRHIGEHESLPEVVANAVHNAVTTVRTEQKREFDEEVSRINMGVEEQVAAAVRSATAAAEERARRARNLAISLGFVAFLAGVAGMSLGVVALFAG